MEVLKVLNNSVVLAKDHDDRQVVLTGRGLGFQTRRGDQVDERLVEEAFVPDAHHDTEQILAYLAEIPPEHVSLAKEILDHAQQQLETTFAQSMVFPLADHISFAVKRARNNIAIEYALLGDVSYLYPNEFRAAQQAVTLVGQRTGVQLPLDEAVPIALHFVNALFATEDLSRTFRMTEVFRRIFDILETFYECTFDPKTINAARFITHLRYFFVRVDNDSQLVENAESFANTVRHTFPAAHLCAERIKTFLELRLEQPITSAELLYLTLHVARLTDEQPT